MKKETVDLKQKTRGGGYWAEDLEGGNEEACNCNHIIISKTNMILKIYCKNEVFWVRN